jgi:hypothetical protein
MRFIEVHRRKNIRFNSLISKHLLDYEKIRISLAKSFGFRFLILNFFNSKKNTIFAALN